MATKSEIPGVMAAAALIDMKSKVCSHTFTYLYNEPAIAYVRFKLNHNDTDQENCTRNGHVSSDEEDCEIKDNVDTETDLNEKNSPPPNNGAGELFKINGQYTAIQQFFHYAYRGTHLRHLNLYEYICSIQVVNIITKKIPRPISPHVSDESISETEEKEQGSPFINPTDYKNDRFRFHEDHPLYATHTQMTRSTFCVPILAGRHPPTLSIPDDWEDSKFLQKANQLAQYYLTLHDPWNMDTDT